MRALLLAMLALVPLSCKSNVNEKPVFPVSGQVLFKGKPTPGALVVFHPVDDPDPEAPRPHGRADQDSRFTLTTYRANDGAPAGQYVVTIDWRKELPNHRAGARSLVPQRYSTPRDSPLRATIAAESNELAPFKIAQ